MRNLKEYPVTKEEIEKYLKFLADEIDFQEHVGDMGPLLLREAIRHVRGSTLELSDLGTVQDRGQEVGGG